MRAPESELALVALAIRDPRCFDEVMVTADHFGEFAYRAIWDAISRLRESGKAVDELTVLDALGDHPAALEIGKVAAAPAISSSIATYAAKVKDAHTARRVVDALGVMQAQATELGGAELVGLGLRLLSQIDQHGEARGMTIGDMAKERNRQLQELCEQRDRGESAHTGISTGLDSLDGVLGGFQRGIVTVVGARPAMGKSSFAMGIADTASSAGIGVHVFSLEDTRASYVDRAFSRRSKVPSTSIRTLALTRDDMSRLSFAMKGLGSNCKWFVDDDAGLSADDLVRQVRRHRRELGTELVIVDYLTLLSWPKGCSSRYEAVTSNINILADAAKQDGMAYVVLCQLNRGLEQREDKRPRLSDLRESGAIEERCKAALFLYRAHVYDDKADPGEIEIIVAKNSQGETGLVKARWDGPTTTISDRDSNPHR